MVLFKPGQQTLPFNEALQRFFQRWHEGSEKKTGIGMIRGAKFSLSHFAQPP